MKKLSKLALSFALLMGLAGCGSTEQKPDPKEIVIAANEKTMALDCQEMEMTMTYNMMGMTIEMPMNCSIVKKDGEIVAMETSIESMGEETKMLFVDGVIYMETQGLKVKIPATFEEFQELNGESSTSLDLTAEMIEAATEGETDEEGNTTYTLTLTQEAIDAFSSNASQNMTSGIEAETEISEFSYVVTVDSEGYLSGMIANIAMKLSTEGLSFDTSVIVDMKYKNLGKTFEIKAPNDAAEYTELSMSDLTGE